jgi:hypothetical protein
MRSLDGRVLGTGSAGPITKQLVVAFREEIKLGTPYLVGTTA